MREPLLFAAILAVLLVFRLPVLEKKKAKAVRAHPVARTPVGDA